VRLDHLAVTCGDLAQGAAHVENSLGVLLQPGGQHARYSTHNWLLSLGPGEYLEVIAPDPTAPKPKHPVWFGLGQATTPRLGNWIVRVPDLAAALQTATPEAGEGVALERGDLKWCIAVPPDGTMPLGGAFPTLIEWQGTAAHPSTRLTDLGIRLTGLDISHPNAAYLSETIAQSLNDPRIRFHAGPLSLQATFSTPHGPRTLS
jgi:Glyoxalase-like domain